MDCQVLEQATQQSASVTIPEGIKKHVHVVLRDKA